MPKALFTCDDLRAAIELTQYGSQREVADVLDVGETLISHAFKRRCVEEARIYRAGRARYRGVPIGRQKPPQDCHKLIQTVRQHGSLPRAASALGMSYANLHRHFYGTGDCGGYADQVTEITGRKRPRKPLQRECEKYLAALEKSGGDFEKAGARVGMQGRALRHVFYGLGAKTPGKCQEYAERARRIASGERSAMDLPGWKEGVEAREQTWQPETPPPRGRAKKFKIEHVGKRLSPEQKRLKKKHTYSKVKHGGRELPILSPTPEGCADVMESFRLNDGNFRAMGREYGVAYKTIQHFLKQHCSQHHAEIRAAFADRKIRGRKPTFLDGLFGFMGFH
jgi:hypothetical protein